MSDEVTPSTEGAVPSVRERIRSLLRTIPPARVLWILLAGLAAYGLYFLGTGIGAATALGLPIVAVLVDLLFQKVRFETPRFPDAAIATGLFLALLLPPIAPFAAAAGATIAAIGLRHVLRTRGRPWFNPAASGVVVAAVLFGLSPAWWGAINESLVIGLGLVLFAWQWRNWRLPSVFLASYAGLATLQRVIFSLSSGLVLVPRVLFLSAVDPTVLFFGFFMVAEPRTAPSDKGLQPLYAILVAGSAALLPLVFPTLSAVVGLLLGNLVAVAMRALPSASRTPAARARGAETRGAAARSRPSASAARWTIGRRIGAGFAVLLLVGIVAGATVTPTTHSAPLVGSRPISGGGGTAVSAAQCQSDNQSIGSSTLASLHKALGPSVVLSYNPSTNVVVFYDPVNSVTVTETDLYEDYGFAEFNGDDYTSAGCVP